MRLRQVHWAASSPLLERPTAQPSIAAIAILSTHERLHVCAHVARKHFTVESPLLGFVVVDLCAVAPFEHRHDTALAAYFRNRCPQHSTPSALRPQQQPARAVGSQQCHTENGCSEPGKIRLVEIETIRSHLVDELDVALIDTTSIKPSR